MYITKARLVVIGLISISLIAAIGFYTGHHLKDNQHQQSGNEDDISKEVGEDTLGVSASELIAHYHRDAYGAHHKYRFKGIIVKGQIKRIDKSELSDIGLVNQFITTVVLWGEDPAPLDIKQNRILNQQNRILTAAQEVIGEASTPLDIKHRGDEVICIFSSSQTYSLRHLNTDDFVEIRGEIGSLGQYHDSFYLPIANCVLVKHIPSPAKDITDE